MDGAQHVGDHGHRPGLRAGRLPPISAWTSTPMRSVRHTLEFNYRESSAPLYLTNFFVDDVVLGSGDGGVCSNLSDVPWLSEVPTNGTTAPGRSTPVQVTFDSNGLAAGTYTANLCIDSNDPDAGPGNETELVVVPVRLMDGDTADPHLQRRG